MFNSSILSFVKLASLSFSATSGAASAMTPYKYGSNVIDGQFKVEYFQGNAYHSLFFIPKFTWTAQ